MIEQTCCDNAIELACLRKDVEDWKKRASLAEAEAQHLRDSLQDRIATYHTNGVQSLQKALIDTRYQLDGFRFEVEQATTWKEIRAAVEKSR